MTSGTHNTRSHREPLEIRERNTGSVSAGGNITPIEDVATGMALACHTETTLRTSCHPVSVPIVALQSPDTLYITHV